MHSRPPVYKMGMRSRSSITWAGASPPQADLPRSRFSATAATSSWPKWGGQGQKRIRDARVFIVGVGGLGSPVALYLAAAGVGTLGLIDSDTADLSNLQRQVIHTTRDLGTPKVLSAQARIAAINPDVKVECMFERLTSRNILDRIRNYDILVDGSDTFATKFLLNDAAVMAGKPLIHGGILRFVGQVFTILPKESACYRCLFKEPPPSGAVPSCQEAGILGAVAGVIGTIQATEVLKLILKKGRPLTDRLLTYDALTTRLRTVRLHRQPGCQVCGPNPEITVLRDEEQQVCTS